MRRRRWPQPRSPPQPGHHARSLQRILRRQLPRQQHPPRRGQGAVQQRPPRRGQAAVQRPPVVPQRPHDDVEIKETQDHQELQGMAVDVPDPVEERTVKKARANALWCIGGLPANILQTTIVMMMLVQSGVWTDKPIYGHLSGELLDPVLVQAGRDRE